MVLLLITFITFFIQTFVNTHTTQHKNFQFIARPLISAIFWKSFHWVQNKRLFFLLISNANLSLAVFDFLYCFTQTIFSLKGQTYENVMTYLLNKLSTLHVQTMNNSNTSYVLHIEEHCCFRITCTVWLYQSCKQSGISSVNKCMSA